jgi:multidrug resistance efflux pump
VLLIASACAAAVLCLVPVPNDVTAPVRLEGAVQRALTAPDDGYLQQVNARPGDAVKQGEVLAELAQQDLQLERKRLEGELAQHESAYGSALALADRAALVSSQARMEQARSKLEAVSRQIERARITAPFDGVLISGDLVQSLGAPVQRGSPLLVVSPSDRYRIIVEIDERDIADVAIGAPGRLRLTALPDQSTAFSVLRIAPVAVTRDGRHFFEAEGRLDSTSATLRPGLEGVARIEAPRRSLAGIALRRLTGWLRLALWSTGWWG